MPFCGFEAFLGKFIENFSFYSEKWLSQKRAVNYSESWFFLPCQKGKNLRKFGFDKTTIVDQISKMG